MNGLPAWPLGGPVWPAPARSTPAAAAADSRGPARWFEDAVGGADLRAEVAPEARGLSVDGHAARVLDLLLGGRGPA